MAKYTWLMYLWAKYYVCNALVCNVPITVKSKPTKLYLFDDIHQIHKYFELSSINLYC